MNTPDFHLCECPEFDGITVFRCRTCGGLHCDNGDGFVLFGEIVHGMDWGQTQYAVQHLSPVFADRVEQIDLNGIRLQGDTADYHGLRVHIEDVPRLVERLGAAIARHRAPFDRFVSWATMGEPT